MQYKFLHSPYDATDANSYLQRMKGKVAVSDGDSVMEENQTDPGTNANNNPISAGNIYTAKTGRSDCYFEGEYKPGQYQREIRLDSEVENWSLTTQNPKLSERLYIIVKPDNEEMVTNSSTNQGADLRYRIRIHLNYLVEFKELKPGLRYPVNNQPLTVSISQTTVTP